MTLAQIKRQCPVFADNICPFAKLPKEHKGAAGKCPAFQKSCPFKDYKTIREFDGKLGQMRDQCEGDAAYEQFLRQIGLKVKTKEAIVGSACPFCWLQRGIHTSY